MPKSEKIIVRSVRLTFGPGDHRTFEPGQEDAFDEALDQMVADAEESEGEFDKDAVLERLETNGDITGYAGVADEDLQNRDPQLRAIQQFEVEDEQRAEDDGTTARGAAGGRKRKATKSAAKDDGEGAEA